MSIQSRHTCLRLELRLALVHRPWPLHRLQELETRHQKVSMEIYDQWVRPKHHFRMHIGLQAQAFGLLLSTDAGEAKHQEYKGALSELTGHLSDKTQLAMSIASHMLNTQVEQAEKRSPFRGYVAASARADAAVLAWLRRSPVASQTAATVRAAAARTAAGTTVGAGDILLPLPLWPRKAAKIIECWLDNQLRFLVQLLELDSKLHEIN